MERRIAFLVALAAGLLAAKLTEVYCPRAPGTLIPGSKSLPFEETAPAAAPSGPRGEVAQPGSTAADPIIRANTLGELTPELRSLAEHAPVTAAARLTALASALQPEFAGAIASAWGKIDPEVAASWAANRLEGKTRIAALLSLSADWAAADPVGAASSLSSIPEARQSEFLNVVGTQWARHDPVGALAWAEQLPGGPARDGFLAGAAATIGEASPVQAAQLAAGITAGSLQDDTALTVALEWSRSDPIGAADWVKMFPVGDLRQRTLRNLVSLWAEESSQSAPAALLCWPAGPERDEAIRHYLDEVLETEPSRGLQVLSAIGDSDIRSEESQRLLQHWRRLDPTAANAWLARSVAPRPD